MSDWDPHSYRDLSDGAFPDGDESLELPLEMFFAEDRGAPDRVASQASLESSVLSRVDSANGFISKRGRRLVTLGRLGVAVLGLAILAGLAVADRLGMAPWNSPAPAGPVADLVSSASVKTEVEVQRVRELRDELLRVVSVRSDPEVVLVDRSKPDVVRRVPGRDGAPGYTLLISSGPYLSAGGVGDPIPSQSTLIRFEDGFAMPAMAGSRGTELRWPASDDVASSLISLDGFPSSQAPKSLSPAWFAERSEDAR